MRLGIHPAEGFGSPNTPKTLSRYQNHVVRDAFGMVREGSGNYLLLGLPPTDSTSCRVREGSGGFGRVRKGSPRAGGKIAIGGVYFCLRGFS